MPWIPREDSYNNKNVFKTEFHRFIKEITNTYKRREKTKIVGNKSNNIIYITINTVLRKQINYSVTI